MKQNVHDYLLNFNSSQFRQDLISWFEKEQRDLPWRKNQDPYKVWVSEIMLQQTRVETVIPYFNNFINRFPTIHQLAEAEEEKVLKAWEGLGYYSRVRNLYTAVKEVKEHYGGKVPDTPKELAALKGVGPYTTGAILSIAYGVAEPAVDGNVMRVLSRLLLIWDDIAKQKTRKIFEDVIRLLISKENPSYFNQGLMEVGATICTPTSPACSLCPLQQHCRAFKEGIQKELPVKSKKKQPRTVQMSAAVLTDKDGKILIQKRPSEGLLANLWQFPNSETASELLTPKEQLRHYLQNEYKLEVKLGDPFTQIQHVFSHLIWNISVFEGEMIETVKATDDLKVVSFQEIEQYPFPVSHQRIFREYKQKRSLLS